MTFYYPEYLKAQDIRTASTYTNSRYYSTQSQLLTHSTLSIIPNITFKAFSKPTYYFYTRLGVVVDIHTSLELTGRDSTYTSSGGNTYEFITTGDEKYSYHVNIGAQVAVGLQFRITEVLRGFAEIAGSFLPAQLVTLVWNIKNQDITNGSQPSTSYYIYNIAYVKSGNNQNQVVINGSTTTDAETLPKNDPQH